MTQKHTYQSMQTARQSSPLVRTVASVAVVLPLVMGTAGTATIGLTAVTVTEAHAFGISDIKNAAKKVGGAVKKGTKKAGGAVKKGAKKVGGAVKKGAKGVAKGAGSISKKAGNAGLVVVGEAYKAVGVGGATLYLKATGNYTEDNKRHLESLRRGVDKYLTVEQIGRGVGAAGKKVGKVITGRNQIGGSLPRPDKSKAENALADYMNRRGRVTRKTYGDRTLKPGVVKGGGFQRKRNSAPVKVITRKEIIRRFTGRVRLPEGAGAKKFHGVPLQKRPIIGRDKSVRGNPVYGKPTKVRKVQGIRLKDIRKSRRHSKRRVIGHDKSAFGRPVIAKRRKTNSRRRLNTRSFNRSRQSMSNRLKRRFDQRRTRRMSSNGRSHRSGGNNRGNRRR